MMSHESIQAEFRGHHERLLSLERGATSLSNRTEGLEKKLDTLKNWMMGTLATAVIQLLVLLLKK